MGAILLEKNGSSARGAFDAGAQFNMIQVGILTPEMFQDACNPLRLVTVTWDPLPGGTQEVATYFFSYVHGDGSKHPEKESPGTFLSIS